MFNTERSKECKEGMRSDRRHVGMQRGGLSAMYTPADCSIANLPTAIYRVKQSASRHKRGSGWSAGSLPPIGVVVATGGLEHSLHRLADTGISWYLLLALQTTPAKLAVLNS